MIYGYGATHSCTVQVLLHWLHSIALTKCGDKNTFTNMSLPSCSLLSVTPLQLCPVPTIRLLTLALALWFMHENTPALPRTHRPTAYTGFSLFICPLKEKQLASPVQKACFML